MAVSRESCHPKNDSLFTKKTLENNSRKVECSCIKLNGLKGQYILFVVTIFFCLLTLPMIGSILIPTSWEYSTDTEKIINDTLFRLIYDYLEVNLVDFTTK